MQHLPIKKWKIQTDPPLYNLHLFSPQIKKCANRSQRTEKRKLRLSLHKLNRNRASLPHYLVEFAILPTHKISVTEKGYNYPYKKKKDTAILIIQFV